MIFLTGAKLWDINECSKKNLRSNGTIEEYKVSIVAKAYTEEQDIYYFNSYSLVARLMTLNVLLFLAALHGLLAHQMVVKTTFLNGELEEETYMD